MTFSITSNRLQTVMFDPLSYMHPTRFALPESFDNPKQHAIINRMLLDHYQLSSESPQAVPGSIDSVLLTHWSQLPQLAYLLACQRFRVALSRGGKLLSLPGWARSFAVLPLRECNEDPMSSDGHRTLDTAALLEHGLVDLLAHCRGLAPALRQRIPLLFPPIVTVMTMPFSPPAVVPKRDDILFILALQHVKKFPGNTTLPNG